MPVLEVNGRKYDLDDDGFLQDPKAWDRLVAMDLADVEGVSQLTEAHWKVIRWVRRYWNDNHSAPATRESCTQTGITLAEVYDLFPSGPTKGVCKLAGLPKPTGCV